MNAFLFSVQPVPQPDTGLPRATAEQRVGAIILCRMDSKRLPGKPLCVVHGQPLLSYVHARCHQVPELAGDIVVATSRRAVDDPIERYCLERGWQVFRGPALNVAKRVLLCARRHGFSHFARINGDSPWLEPALLSQACRLARQSGSDFVTNLHPRSFPYGISAEVVKTEAFEKAYRKMHAPRHREHVTLYFYEHMDQVTYVNILGDEGLVQGAKLTVDTEEDLRLFAKLVGQAGQDCSSWPYPKVAEAYRRLEKM